MKDYEIIQTEFADHMTSSYLQYAQEVLEDRAIPSASDGLKPVQRRILQSLFYLGLHPNSQYKKCARAVGDTLGRLHPHGDQSVYDAMVVQAQDFKQRYPLVDIHGNYGSIDGDPAAAMRYTECRLSRYGEMMMADADKETVDMKPNYDESESEAVDLPGLLPLLLLNGNQGIGVGLATSFVPHCAKDVFKAIDKYLSNVLKGKETSPYELIDIIKAPDFPTGGIITNLEGVRKGYLTGKGTVRIRSRYEVQIDKKGNESIIITEIPYGVIKSKMIVKMDELRKNGVTPEIKEIRDESSKDGIRIVIELKKGSNSQLVINNLLKSTELETTVSMNHQALINGKIREKLTLKDMIECFIDHALDVTKRKSQYILDKEKIRYHIVLGFLTIAPTILEAIKIITESETDDDIYTNLKSVYDLDDEQITAIISRQIRSLKKMSQTEFEDEAEKLATDIERLTKIVTDDIELITETRKVLQETANVFNKDTRLTEIDETASVINSDKELVAQEDVVMIITHNNMIKCVKASEYNAQERAGNGVQLKTAEDDFVERILTLTTHDELVIVTDAGKAYVISAYKIPIVGKNAVGKYLNNYVDIDFNTEKIVTILIVDEKTIQDEENCILFVSKNGLAKRLSYGNLPQTKNGAKVVTIRDDDRIVSCLAINNSDNVFIAASNGKGLKTAADNFSIQGRAGSGVRAMKFKDEEDAVVNTVIANANDVVMVVTENGIGKRLDMNLFNEKGRGGHGQCYYKIDNKTGNIADIVNIKEDETLITTTINGMIIRIPADSIGSMGRTAKGVKIVNLKNDDKVVAIASAPKQEDEDDSDE